MVTSAAAERALTAPAPVSRKRRAAVGRAQPHHATATPLSLTFIVRLRSCATAQERSICGAFRRPG